VASCLPLHARVRPLGAQPSGIHQWRLPSRRFAVAWRGCRMVLLRWPRPTAGPRSHVHRYPRARLARPARRGEEASWSAVLVSAVARPPPRGSVCVRCICIVPCADLLTPSMRAAPWQLPVRASFHLDHHVRVLLHGGAVCVVFSNRSHRRGAPPSLHQHGDHLPWLSYRLKTHSLRTCVALASKLLRPGCTGTGSSASG